MPVPAFTEHGLLPPGIHSCSLAEAAAALCTNDPRTAIWTGLEGFLAWAAKLPHPIEVYVDGSYVTDKDVPGDVDVVVDISGCDPAAQAEWVQTWSAEWADVKAAFNVDFYPVVIGDGNDFIAFFQYVRADEAINRGIGPAVRKGILKVEP